MLHIVFINLKVRYMPFFVIFIIVPLSEIIVFMSVSDKIGLSMALLMALFTAILGGFIVKYQGIQTIITAQKSIENGQIPSKELFDGLCIVAAGATLITPGFITDIIGFSLLVPAIRNILRQKLTNSSKFQATGFNHEYKKDLDAIDVEYETIEENDKP